MLYDILQKLINNPFLAKHTGGSFSKERDDLLKSSPLIFTTADRKSKRILIKPNLSKVSSSNADVINLKFETSISFDASEVPGYYNFIGSLSFGKPIDGISISRVYNRKIIPIDKNIFFETGKMGSCNGKVTPSIPVEWTYGENRLGARGLNYLVKIIKTGASGAAKYKFTKCPYIDLSINANKFNFFISTVGDPLIYKTIPFSEIVPCVEIENGYLVGLKKWFEKTLVGIHIETRIKSDNTSIVLLLVDSQKLQVLDEDFDTVLKELTLSVPIQSFTYAKGKIYALGEDQQVYIIDQTTGVCDPITGCQLSGTHKGIMADHSQSKVYAGTSDGKLLVLNSADDSFTIYEDVGFNLEAKNYDGIGFDAYDNVYYNGNQLIDFSATPTLGAVLPGKISWNTIQQTKSYAGYPDTVLDVYSLSGSLLSSYTTLGNQPGHYVFRTIYGYVISRSQLGSWGSNHGAYMAWGILPYHPDDIALWQQNKGESKVWMAWNGTDWVPEDVTDEVPSGVIDSTNKVYVLANPVEPGTISITVDGSATPITDDGAGVLSDTGTVDYATKTITLNAAPTTSITVTYKIDGQLTGADVEIEDGVHLNFQDGIEAPHFVKDEYFSFLVGEGFVKDNLQTASFSTSMHVVPVHEVTAETFTISSTEMYAAGQSQTGFMRLDSSIGLSAKIAGTDATIITTGDPAAGQIFVDYTSGLLKFNSADTGKTITEMKYVWLQRPQ